MCGGGGQILIIITNGSCDGLDKPGHQQSHQSLRCSHR